jgi:phosphoglycerol transferase
MGLTRHKDDGKSLWQTVLFAGLALFLYRGSNLVQATFGDIGVEQIVFHLSSPAVGVPSRLIREAIRELLVKPVFLMGLLYGLLVLFERRFNPLLRYAKRLIYASTFSVAALGSYDLYHTTGIGSYIQDRSVNFGDAFDWFERYYRFPSVSFDDRQIKLNLVWVYVESLEARHVASAGFQSDGVYGSTGVRHFVNLPGTGWTIGGMAASQCGLPLMPVGLLGTNGLGDADHFLPKIQCLGDMLKGQGYRSEFIGGADSAFAGKSKFLSAHGFDHVVGRQEIKAETGKDYPLDYWGYTDHDVLDMVFKKIVALHQADQPFYVNALTLNTHGPKGYLSSYCRERGWQNKLNDIFSCTLNQLRDFFGKLNDHGILSNTVLVISGDHPFMGGSSERFFSSESESNRSVFFKVFRPDSMGLDVQVMNHFDMLPTVLHALGFKVADGQAGMGRNLYYRKSLSEEVPAEVLSQALRQPSKKYRDAWTP